VAGWTSADLDTGARGKTLFLCWGKNLGRPVCSQDTILIEIPQVLNNNPSISINWGEVLDQLIVLTTSQEVATFLHGVGWLVNYLLSYVVNIMFYLRDRKITSASGYVVLQMESY
jgi:hypothetical protein